MAKASRTLFGKSVVWYGFESQNNLWVSWNSSIFNKNVWRESSDGKRLEFYFRLVTASGSESYVVSFGGLKIKYMICSHRQKCVVQKVYIDLRVGFFALFSLKFIFVKKLEQFIVLFLRCILLWTSPTSGTSLADSATSLGGMSMWNLIEEVW